ncbi:hypothetical protein V1477_005468 [Vespula maculifrons]|uniref:Uncharacterized protein n=1 Tax=Vespula maculifrons TaxID=7453 RepID=A0ABD2CPP5_VESMC
MAQHPSSDDSRRSKREQQRSGLALTHSFQIKERSSTRHRGPRHFLFYELDKFIVSSFVPTRKAVDFVEKVGFDSHPQTDISAANTVSLGFASIICAYNEETTFRSVTPRAKKQDSQPKRLSLTFNRVKNSCLLVG